MGRVIAACVPQDVTTDPCTVTGATKTLSFTPLANDRLGSIVHSNGLGTAIGYEAFGPIKDITVGSSPVPLKLAYGYDDVLNVETITETRNGSLVSPSFGFEYDAVYRLTEATHPPNVDLPTTPSPDSFEYDTAGNRDDDPESATPWAYDANNRLIEGPDVDVYCYDADGNLTGTRADPYTCTSGTNVRAFTWDAQSRLTSFSEGSTSASYLYDPFGRRIKKTVGGTATLYLWDGDQLLAEYDTSGNRTVRYAYAGGFAPMQFARVNGSSEDVYDVHSDHLDTPRMLTDNAGVPSWRASYQAFGKAYLSSDPDGSIVTTTPPIAFNLRFPGQYYDAESGLHYNRFRHYSPDVGRYVSADPIGQIGGVNLYRYGLGNPLSFIDPLGLKFGVIGPQGPARARVEAALERFRSTPRGQEIEAATGDRLVPIEVNEEGTNRYSEEKDWIWIDPDSPECVETEDGLQNIPIEARIAHEGGHAIGDHDDGPGGLNNVNKNENPVRKALGYPDRTGLDKCQCPGPWR
jgi:RHS repeat-associated protein